MPHFLVTSRASTDSEPSPTDLVSHTDHNTLLDALGVPNAFWHKPEFTIEFGDGRQVQWRPVGILDLAAHDIAGFIRNSYEVEIEKSRILAALPDFIARLVRDADDED